MSSRLYNEVIISRYKEDQYLRNLANISQLGLFVNNYNKRFDVGLNDFDINCYLNKESLDHYVLKKIMNDTKFINTRECDNYFDYLKKLVNNNKYEYYTNVVLFNIMNNTKYLKYKTKYGFTKNNHIINFNKVTLEINKLTIKIRYNEFISQEEIESLCMFVNDYRENSVILEDFIKYLFNHLIQKKCDIKISFSMILTILTYISYTCKKIERNGFDLRNIQVFVSDLKENKNVNNEYLNNIMTSLKKNNTDDFSKVLVNICREIVCLYQKYVAFSKVNSKTNYMDFYTYGYPVIVDSIINEEFSEDKIDGDNRDGEMQANKLSWQMCYDLYSNILDNSSLKRELMGECIKNINSRSDFSYKRDGSGKFIDFVKYNNDNMLKIMKDNERREKYFKKYPNLRYVFKNNGDINYDILFVRNFGSTLIGARMMQDFINNSLTVKIIKEKLSNFDRESLENNIYLGIDYGNKRLWEIKYYVYEKSLNSLMVDEKFISFVNDTMDSHLLAIKNGKKLLNEIIGCYTYDTLIDSKVVQAKDLYKQISMITSYSVKKSGR